MCGVICDVVTVFKWVTVLSSWLRWGMGGKNRVVGSEYMSVRFDVDDAITIVVDL